MKQDQMLVLVRAPSVTRQGEVATPPDHEIWARPRDGVGALARKIAEALEERPYVDVACMGATSTNNGIKAVAELRRVWTTQHPERSDILCQPFFSSIVGDGGEERTRVILRVFTKFF